MGRPVVMAVAPDPAALRPVADELRKRYGSDYDVRCLASRRRHCASSRRSARRAGR
jgi:hypothetical protein